MIVEEFSKYIVLFQVVLITSIFIMALKASGHRGLNGARVFFVWFAIGSLFQIFFSASNFFAITFNNPTAAYLRSIIMPTFVRICYFVAMVLLIRHLKKIDKIFEIKQHEIDDIKRRFKL